MAEEKKLTGYPSIDKPWLKYYSEEAINAPLPECTIYEYLMENNKDYPEDIAILYLGRKIKYGELFRQIDRSAAAFIALGVKPGEIVTVALPSIPEALYVVYALNKIGAVANMIHPLAGERELINYLIEVKSKVAVLFEGTFQIIKDSIGQTSVEHAIVVSAGESLPLGVRQLYFLKTPRLKLPEASVFQSWKAFLLRGQSSEIPSVNKDFHALALISHTGGTTGEPKGVMLSDYNVNALIYQIVCGFDYERQGCSLVVLPPFINYSLVEACLAMFAIGYKTALIPNYKAESFVKYIKKYRPSVVLSIPSYWEVLLSSAELEKCDLSCFEHIYYGGEGMTPEKEQAINSLLMLHGSKTGLCKGLGSTELVAAATQSFPDNNKIGSVGIPLVKTNCKIVDLESTNELECMQEGEICFSGPTLMLGYYNKLEETNQIIKVHSDGQRWLHTGDTGYLDRNGTVFITGRIKRIIITKGKDGISTKMFPDRIEKAVYKHPTVKYCCVIGVPDKTRINYPKAFVVLKDKSAERVKITAEILDICKKELPGYMVPDVIEYRNDLPRTPRGKIDYRAMEELAREM